MHLRHLTQLLLCHVEVNHGRRFDDQPAAVGEEQRHVLQYIGFTLLKGGHFVSCGGASCRVYIYNVETTVMRCEPFQTVATVDGKIVKTQHFAVVFHQRAEERVAFHIIHMCRNKSLQRRGPSLSLCHGYAVDPHPACQVGEGNAFRLARQRVGHTRLILRSGLRRTLLTVQPGRIPELFVLQQRRPLLLRHAHPLYLLHGGRHVNRRIPRGR